MRLIFRESGAGVARLSLLVGASVAALTLLVLPAPLAAQQSQEVYIIQGGDGAPDLDIRQARRGFDLFAGGDAALSGMRMTGNYGAAYSNYGDCNNILRSCQSQRVFRSGASSAPFFLHEWAVGAPPSQWLKIRAVAPSVANAVGRGWTAAYNDELVGNPLRFGPRDGTLGTLFSGSTGTADGSCRDHTGNQNGNFFEGGTGAQLLANSDCAETWGSQGWPGSNPIDLEGWAAYRDASGVNFNFDFWRVPDEFKRLDKDFLGTNFTTVGQSADFWQEQLEAFGSVMPGGTGTPRVRGYPLGIVVHFEAFNFAVPNVSGVKFVQALIINRSEDVWGTPIDYDSLYFGLAHGTLYTSQQVSEYDLPEMGMVLFHNNNAQGAGGPCDDTFRAGIYTPPCTFGNGSTIRGYLPGAYAVMVLKSPIGDLRNKLFTRVGSPFYDPAHPNAGDTITYNHHKMGDFGNAHANTWAYSPRAAFGLMSGTEDNVLDGRDVATLNTRSQFGIFRNEGWNAGVRGRYNKWVPPGNWDYDKDGVLDTLDLVGCGTYGCAQWSSDTAPGLPGSPGPINNRGNIGGLVGVGPFSLKAGDTTAFVYAMMGDADSARAWTQFNGAYNLYLDFFLAPEAPPPCEIVSTRVQPGSDEFGTANPSVTITCSDDPEVWVDPFLMKVAADVEAAASGTIYGTLRDNNPGLVASIRARAANNLERIEIYKSCDGGNTYTANDGDCVGDPATTEDGSAAGFGWEAYEIRDVDASDGNVSNVFEDNNVDGGRTYLYTFVGKSRGATFLLSDAPGSPPVEFQFAPTIRNVLSRSTSDPNVASVYVPASRPAGYRSASVTFTNTQRATTDFVVQLSDDAVARSYRAVFGNRIVVRRDSSVADEAAIQSLVTIERRERVSGVADSLIESETLTFASGEVFQVAGTPGAPAIAADTLANGDTVTVYTTVRYSGLGFVLASPDGPIFGSITLTGEDATPTGLLTQAAFPGFTIDADNDVAGSFNTGAERQVRGPISIEKLKLQPADTVVPRSALVVPFMVQFRESNAIRSSTDAVGLYRATWTADPWGVERGFVPNYSNPGATEAEVVSALEARPVGTTGLTDAETATLVGVPQDQLVPVKVPFALRNTTFDRPVSVAMAGRLNNRAVLGNGTDTLSVEIPVDQWIPSDRLYLIEDIVEDSTTASGLVLDATGVPVQRTRRAVTYTQMVLGCDQIRESCNPVVQGVRGATGYNAMSEGDRTEWMYYVGFRPTGEYAFDVTGAVSGSEITAVTDSALALVRVVPNPFVLYSEYQSTFNESRLMFTNLPSRGTLRIYTVAGQFVQQIAWEGDDLEGDGDLFWDMRTREGIDIASGLYIWVLTAPTNPSSAGSATLQARGKFVVIRGDSR